MREEQPPPQKRMRFHSRELLESRQNLYIDRSRPELLDKFIVVDSHLLPVRRDRALDVPGGDDLLVFSGRIGLG